MTKRYLNLKELFAIALMIIGALTPRFLVLRPNRIENGKSLSLMTAAGDRKSLVAVLLFLMIGFIVISHVIDKRLKPRVGRTGFSYEPILKWTKYIVITALVPLMLIQSSVWANEFLTYESSAARVSFGISFWLILVGLIYLLQQTKYSFVTILTLFTVIIVLFIAYKMGNLSGLSIIREYSNKSSRINDEVIRHMKLSVSSTVTGLFLSSILAGQAYRYPRRRGLVMGIVNMAQVIPTLTFFRTDNDSINPISIHVSRTKKLWHKWYWFFSGIYCIDHVCITAFDWQYISRL